MSEHVIVLITAPSVEMGRQLARVLVEEKVVACVNILPGIHSIYPWEGEIQEDREVLLIAKTRAALVEDQVIPLVQANHPYDLPEIIALPVVKGSKRYLDWIKEETKG